MGSAISSFRKIDFAAAAVTDEHGEEKKIVGKKNASFFIYTVQLNILSNNSRPVI